jgi:hypothetical protein
VTAGWVVPKPFAASDEFNPRKHYLAARNPPKRGGFQGTIALRIWHQNRIYYLDDTIGLHDVCLRDFGDITFFVRDEDLASSLCKSKRLTLDGIDRRLAVASPDPVP